MNVDAFDLKAHTKGIYAIPTSKRYVYSTEFVSVLPYEANNAGNLPDGIHELNFPLRDLNVVYSFSMDTGRKSP